MRFSTILSISLVLAALPVSAEVYKWKTQSGEIQYGQFPPAGVKAERMTAGGLKAMPEPVMEEPEEPAPSADSEGEAAGTDAEAAPAEPLSPQQRLQQLEEQRAEQARQASEEAATAKQAAQRKRSCAGARSNLAVLQTEGHRRMRLPDGTLTFLSDEEKAQRVAEAEQIIAESCD